MRAGTSSTGGLRAAEVTGIGRSRPSRTYGRTVPSPWNEVGARPAIWSVTAVAAPREGTCVASVPVSPVNSFIRKGAVRRHAC